MFSSRIPSGRFALTLALAAALAAFGTPGSALAKKSSHAHQDEAAPRSAKATKGGKASTKAAEHARAEPKLSRAQAKAQARADRQERVERPTRAAAAKPMTRAARLAEARADRLEEARAARAARRTARQEALAAAEPRAPRMVAAIAKPSMGQMYGLHGTPDALELKSSVALVVDQDTSEVLFAKNSDAVLPIASLTKLMTAVVVAEAHQPLDDIIEITEQDIDTEKGSRSRLVVGTQLSRGEMLHLALMSSENRAANSLGRHYPGGLRAAVEAMNRKAQMLGMNSTHYVEPTGLSSENQSSAADLARLVKAAYQFPLLRELSTSPEYQVAVGSKTLQYRNTNGLVRSPQWEIGLQKTGYISEAGRCLVMQARMVGRKVIMVFLDSAGKYSRIGDAERVRRWLEESDMGAGAAATRVSTQPSREVSRPMGLPIM